MFDLTGKAALVTGASGGIGGAVAKALHGQGATVAISGTNKAKLDAVAAELGSRVFVMPCDLRDRQAVTKLAEDAEKILGQTDILVGVEKSLLDVLLGLEPDLGEQPQGASAETHVL